MAFFIKLLCGDAEMKKEYLHPIGLTDVIAESGFSFDLPCGGRGVCGNCRVFAKGVLSKPTEEEITFLGERLEGRERLACFVSVSGDAEIVIPRAFSEEKPADISHFSGRVACALDVGTTSIIFRYYSLPDGEVLKEEHIANPQRVRGNDILTRIQFASNGGLGELKASIEREIENSAGSFSQPIEFYIITGNTAMLHILSGRDVSGLAVAPFSPETLFGFWEGNRYYMPCASAYIGGDVIASVLASGMLELKKPSALLDIGTNNECVLFDGYTLFACSSPAGPAFEGSCISSGMVANDGAIYKVGNKNGEPEIFTIGSAKPKGFCGSGLIDAAAFLLENQYISADGSVISSLPDFGGITLTAEDIAELQLAKSAVCAGLLTLCEEAKVTPEKVYLAGSFGNKIDCDSAEKIGLIPRRTAKIAVSSSGAIEGASMLLLNRELIPIAEKIAKEIKVIELANSEFFEKSFIANIYF